ncbi:DUF3373 family protein [bacterium]|nr:DUF3373 family protein [bacterium]MBU1995261.1 DUF3373 family protein [bacterium]
MKKIVTLSVVAFLSTAAFASADMQTQIDELTKKIESLESSKEKQDKKISEINIQSAKDNIKFDIDFRTSYDKLDYKTVSGAKYSNNALYSNRLWLNMGFAPADEMIFKGQLAYHKAFGSTAFRTDGFPQRGAGFDTFDWISSETLNDDKLRVREAYWLWTPETDNASYTVSIGRRPSTNGFMANLREDDPKDKSPNGHVINMEFDGASAGIKSDVLLPGMLFKICLGRGLTNAKAWANEADTTLSTQSMAATSPNYIVDGNALDTVDMAGFIFIPYDDGQYAVKTTWYRGFNVPGMVMSDYSFGADATPGTADDVQTWQMLNTGDMDGMAVSFKVDGIGDEINDFLDATSFFASYARSVSHPTTDTIRTANATAAFGMLGADAGNMLGSNESKTGDSVWIGAVMPNLTGGKFGLEYNKGSKYWRPFTYGEDTMIGSKLAARGHAYEAYWSQPLIQDVFSMQVRYTYIKYDYTGSNGFFGDGGTPYSMADAKANPNMDPVETASDLRVYFRYRY